MQNKILSPCLACKRIPLPEEFLNEWSMENLKKEVYQAICPCCGYGPATFIFYKEEALIKSWNKIQNLPNRRIMSVSMITECIKSNLELKKCDKCYLKNDCPLKNGLKNGIYR